MLQRLIAGLAAVLNFIFPIFHQARSSRQLAWGIRIVLHLILVAAIVVGLYFLGEYLGVKRYIDYCPTVLKPYFLCILFLLIYSFCWLSWWLWILLFPEKETGDFPDVDEAWETACQALNAARLSLQDLPLFLILGTPEDEERSLIQASQLKLEVAQAPNGPDAPLRLYATRDAIYLTCAGASALGYYARSLVGKAGESSRSLEAHAGPDDEEDVLATMSPSSSKSIDPRRALGKMADVLKQAEREGRPLTKAEKRELRCIYRQDNAHRSILKNPRLIDEQVARLEYLCRLIVRDRAPYCPINGILLLLPLAGTDSDSDASDTGVVRQRDLKAAISTLRIHCPLFAMVCDLETAPGFAAFVQQFTARERLRRIGQRSHLVPDLGQPTAKGETSEPAPAKMVRSLANWMCASVVKSFVANKFQLEKGTADAAAVVECNSRLFLFFDEMHQRGKRLGNILASAIMCGRDLDRLLFGGCYIAATGNDPVHEQAFVKGVLEKLIESQSCVYWTDEALQEEADYRRWRDLGWTVLVAVVVVVLAMVGWLYFKNR